MQSLRTNASIRVSSRTLFNCFSPLNAELNLFVCVRDFTSCVSELIWSCTHAHTNKHKHTHTNKHHARATCRAHNVASQPNSRGTKDKEQGTGNKNGIRKNAGDLGTHAFRHHALSHSTLSVQAFSASINARSNLLACYDSFRAGYQIDVLKELVKILTERKQKGDSSFDSALHEARSPWHMLMSGCHTPRVPPCIPQASRPSTQCTCKKRNVRVF